MRYARTLPGGGPETRHDDFTLRGRRYRGATDHHQATKAREFEGESKARI